MHRGGKASIAASSTASTRNDEVLVCLGKLEHLLAGFIVIHDRADGNLENYISTLASGFVRAFAVPATFSSVLRIEPEMNERVMALAGLHHDVAALAAIAARRSAARHELLAAKGHAAVAAVARFDPNFGFVDEH